MASSSALASVPAAPHCAQRIPPVVVSPAHAISSPQVATSLPRACDCEATGARWRAVDVELSDVIGRRGSAAILRRALVLTRRTHGWLPAPSADAGFDACMQALTRALADQRPEDCGAGRQALEATFHDLLSNLVGVELTGQLLNAPRASPPAMNAAMP